MRRHGEPTIESLVAPRSEFREGPYGRMFRNLPPFQPPANEDPATFFRTLAEKMQEPGNPPGARLDGEIPAGYTYLGQFITHDITFDSSTSSQRRTDPNMIRNFRTPRFDLDSLYGDGPENDPYLYDSRQGNRFLFGTG